MKIDIRKEVRSALFPLSGSLSIVLQREVILNVILPPFENDNPRARAIRESCQAS